MSVPAGERTQNKFEVILKARELAKYTLDITKNKNIFLPEYQTALTNDIINTVKDIFMKCWTANNIRVTKTEEAERRLDLQAQAAEKCNNLLAQIDLAKTVYHLKSKRIKYWAGKTILVRSLIREWRTSDTRRYKYA